MAYEKKPGEAKLFKNKKKETENDPDLTGYYLHDDGVTEEGINAWFNTAASGDKYIKLSFWNKSETAAKGIAEARQSMAPAPQPAPQPQEPFSDDIPF
jgi:hypothetical protein